MRALPARLACAASLWILPVAVLGCEEEEDTTPPGPIAAFEASAVDGHVELTWQNPGDEDYAATLIVRITEKDTAPAPSAPAGGASYAAGTVLGNGVVLSTVVGPPFVDATLDRCERYDYAAWTRDATGNWSTAPSLSGIVDASKAVPVPDAVEDAEVELEDEDTKIRVTWKNPTDGFVFARVVRAPVTFDNGVSGGLVFTTSDEEIVDDVGLQPDTTYHYAIYACGHCADLDQLTEEGSTEKCAEAAEVEITTPADPTIPPETVSAWSGLIEGFYGPPWDHAARRSMLRLLGELGLGRFVHAPKNDPAHNAAIPYTTEDLDRIAELLDEAARARVRLTIALRPRRGAERPGSAEARTLDRKLADLARLGCHDVALSFDDGAATFVPWLASPALAERHAAIVSRASETMCSRSPSSILVVPAIYFGTPADHGRSRGGYWRTLAERLPSDATVAWTGPRIFSQRVTRADVEGARAALGRPIALWNNAIANDWLPLLTGRPFATRGVAHLAFGPIENVEPAAARALDGHLLNGACEPELTKITLACLAELVRDPAAYDPRAAHARALVRVAGPRAAPHLAALYEAVGRHPLVPGSRPVPASPGSPGRDELVVRLARDLGDSPLWPEIRAFARGRRFVLGRPRQVAPSSSIEVEGGVPRSTDGLLRLASHARRVPPGRA